MDRNEVLQVLNQAHTWKHNSLAAYILQVEPYVAPGEESLLELVQAIAAEDIRLSDVTGRAIEALGESPQTPPHDPSVADLNYLSIKYLAGRLLERLKVEFACYEAMASVSPVFAELLASCRNQLLRLAAFTGSNDL